MLRNSSSRLVWLLPLPGSVHVDSHDCCFKSYDFGGGPGGTPSPQPRLLWSSTVGAGCQNTRPGRRSAALRNYLTGPTKVCVVLKNWHSDGGVRVLKLTGDLVCLVQRTGQAQVLQKIEKFHSLLMRLLGTKEPCTVAMETD